MAVGLCVTHAAGTLIDPGPLGTGSMEVRSGEGSRSCWFPGWLFSEIGACDVRARCIFLRGVGAVEEVGVLRVKRLGGRWSWNICGCPGNRFGFPHLSVIAPRVWALAGFTANAVPEGGLGLGVRQCSLVPVLSL